DQLIVGQRKRRRHQHQPQPHPDPEVAPLLGLLGTVMGIIETFKALAASGVSEPSLVSAGMGTALYATGLGIA
ncbi:MotA/TolQ/ExbB proton channel family protein, partial [Klebsiella aerogenes]|uniref:MotA/TolQ/ExbB proton channel family protein n=1 Tax=Klebsiella aerogenes TaxID=548 RepID=UPI001F07D73A